MDNIVGLYTTTEGRISRKTWWLGVVILIVINIVMSLLILPIVGISMMPNMAAIMADGNADPPPSRAHDRRRHAPRRWASLILFLDLRLSSLRAVDQAPARQGQQRHGRDHLPRR